MPDVLQYPSIPEPSQDPASLQTAVLRLKENVELLTGQRGPKDYSLVEGLTSLKKELVVGGRKISARIDELNEVVVTEDMALAQRTLILEAEIDGAKSGEPTLLARLTQVDTARVEGDNALASQTLTLQAEVTNARSGEASLAARLSVINQARVDGDTAIASSVTSLSATVNSNHSTTNAAISNEITARANADSALSSQITTLTATVTTNNTNVNASINSEATARANADSALSTAINNVSAALNTTNANVSTEITARANGDSALSSRIDTLTSTVNGNTSSISTLTSSVNGISVRHGVTGNINGVTGGFMFTGVLKNDGSVVYNLEFHTNVAIYGNLIVAGTVANTQITNNAVTLAAYSTGTGAAQATVNVRSGAYLATVSYYYGGSGGAICYLQINVNGTLYFQIPITYTLVANGTSFVHQNTSFQFSYPASGSITVQGVATGAASSGTVAVTVTELSK